MNFLQTYRRHLIFKLAGIAAVILAVLSSAYLFMSADYARSVRKNTLALNERLTAQTATRIEASWDSLYNITTAFCYSPTVQQYFSPDGNVIHEKGVQPDYEVILTEESETDVQLEKAIELLK